MVTLKKQYAESTVQCDPSDIQGTTRNIHFVNDLYVGFSEEVLYVFRRDKVTLYSSKPIDFSTAGHRIYLATGSIPALRTTLITFETTVALSSASPTNIIFLDLLHDKIMRHPPRGTEINIFEPEIHPNLVVKVSPFADDFTVTFHIKSTGKCIVVCDAKNCPNPILAAKFASRVNHVIKSFHDDITWEVGGE